jgi:hypothetical protein
MKSLRLCDFFNDQYLLSIFIDAASVKTYFTIPHQCPLAFIHSVGDVYHHGSYDRKNVRRLVFLIALPIAVAFMLF